MKAHLQYIHPYMPHTTYNPPLPFISFASLIIFPSNISFCHFSFFTSPQRTPTTLFLFFFFLFRILFLNFFLPLLHFFSSIFPSIIPSYFSLPIFFFLLTAYFNNRVSFFHTLPFSLPQLPPSSVSLVHPSFHPFHPFLTLHVFLLSPLLSAWFKMRTKITLHSSCHFPRHVRFVHSFFVNYSSHPPRRLTSFSHSSSFNFCSRPSTFRDRPPNLNCMVRGVLVTM